MMTTLGQRLKQQRLLLGMTQCFLAKRSGINFKAISHFEGGRREPRFLNAVKLCKALDVSLDWLVGGKRIRGQKVLAPIRTKR